MSPSIKTCFYSLSFWSLAPCLIQESGPGFEEPVSHHSLFSFHVMNYKFKNLCRACFKRHFVGLSFKGIFNLVQAFSVKNNIYSHQTQNGCWMSIGCCGTVFVFMKVLTLRHSLCMRVSVCVVSSDQPWPRPTRVSLYPRPSVWWRARHRSAACTQSSGQNTLTHSVHSFKGPIFYWIHVTNVV